MPRCLVVADRPKRSDDDKATDPQPSAQVVEVEFDQRVILFRADGVALTRKIVF